MSELHFESFDESFFTLRTIEANPQFPDVVWDKYEKRFVTIEHVFDDNPTVKRNFIHGNTGTYLRDSRYRDTDTPQGGKWDLGARITKEKEHLRKKERTIASSRVDLLAEKYASLGLPNFDDDYWEDSIYTRQGTMTPDGILHDNLPTIHD